MYPVCVWPGCSICVVWHNITCTRLSRNGPYHRQAWIYSQSWGKFLSSFTVNWTLHPSTHHPPIHLDFDSTTRWARTTPQNTRPRACAPTAPSPVARCRWRRPHLLRMDCCQGFRHYGGLVDNSANPSEVSYDFPDLEVVPAFLLKRRIMVARCKR